MPQLNVQLIELNVAINHEATLDAQRVLS